MANEISFSMSRNGGAIDVLAAGSQTVTVGTSAPGAGDLEVRVGDPATAPWTKLELEIALDVIWKAILESRTRPTL